MRGRRTKLVIITLVSIVILGMSLIFVSKLLDTFEDDFIIEGQEQLNGTYKTLYEDGVVKSVENFENGKRNGINIYYFPSACIQSVKYFEKGNLNGPSYFLSEAGDTVFIEYYDSNRLEKKEILNDSLFKFELNPLDYGMMLFNNNCRTCHEFKEDSLIQKSVVVLDSLDSNLVDSSYVYLFHQGVTSQDSLSELSDSIHVLLNREKELPNLNDLNSLKTLFENEINRPKLKYKRVKKLRKKTKIS